jgi:hypothetical protein
MHCLCPTTGTQSKSSAILFHSLCCTWKLVGWILYPLYSRWPDRLWVPFLIKLDPYPLWASLVAACSSYIPWFSKISIGFNPQLLMKWGETGETLDVSWCLLGAVPSAEFPQFQASFREDRRRFSVIGHRLASQRWHSTRKNSLRWHIYKFGVIWSWLERVSPKNDRTIPHIDCTNLWIWYLSIRCMSAYLRFQLFSYKFNRFNG